MRECTILVARRLYKSLGVHKTDILNVRVELTMFRYEIIHPHLSSKTRLVNVVCIDASWSTLEQSTKCLQSMTNSREASHVDVIFVRCLVVKLS